MKIGSVKEIKPQEYRVGMTPDCAKSFVMRGHRVLYQSGAGENAGFEDSEYHDAGATVVKDAKTVYDECDMVMKVKEPLPAEYEMLHEDLILFTYLHLAASRELTEELMKRKVRAVAYETIETPSKALPCLKPMSEIAGRLSIQEGAKYLERTYGGRGVLLGGVPGVDRGKVAIVGGGVVGTNACKIAVGMGAEVTILDVNSDRLAYLDDIFSTHITTLYSTDSNIERVVGQCDLLIGAVLLPGARAPHVIKRAHLASMKKGAVVVDVAVDQGGCVETSHPTTHDDPVFVVDGVVHYCVANMPGAVALSSTKALTSTTLPYGLMIAEDGLEAACRKSTAIHHGVNIYAGRCVYPGVARAFDMEWTPLEDIIE